MYWPRAGQGHLLAGRVFIVDIFATMNTRLASTSHSPVTIGHVLHRLYLAGAEVLAADLARRLGGRYRFVFLCLDEIGPLGEELAGEGFEVIDLARRPGVDWSVAKRLRQAVVRHGIDLLHSHQYTPFFYAATSRCLSSEPPVLFTEHGRHYPDRRSVKRVIANRVLLRRHDRVTAVGAFVKQALVYNEGIPAPRIEVVLNGIDPERFSDDHLIGVGADARRELGIPPERPVILQVARFHPVKDHATAIRALAEVVKQVPDALLVLAGDGDRRVDAQSLVDDLGLTSNVRFLGVRSDIPRLMAAADVFMLSSLSEGISVTLLEAMAASLPIVTTDVGGNSEIVVDGETGYLSPRGDESRLAGNLVRLLRDDDARHRMGRAGRQRLLEHFTQRQMHDAYERVYEQMLAGM
jgi:glycosyltransferase involved in cell wall biosynthesis